MNLLRSRTNMTEQDNQESEQQTAIDPQADARPLATEEAETREAPPRIQRDGHTISLRELKVFYGDVMAVKGVDIDFAPNKITAIIGPSGCGKSTLVRSINRMHEEIPGGRIEGEILLDEMPIYGHDIDVVAVRRAIGMVFQRPNPFPTMSIFDNVAAGLRLTGTARGKNLNTIVHEALRGAGLWGEVKSRLDKPAMGLSGGQQQRLCIARALAVQPEVLLMDEPCSALDPVATLRIEELLTDLKERVTIVLVTHNMQQAARVSDITAFMLDGELVEVADTEKIFTNPDDERTEQYVAGKFG
ncbi:MAG: phosphate transport system ATP-binding protein [Thermoleophilaceae bacterium]|nr:phosphate transport system ATP-binding protein [Thermoleophilaceae bacterium]